MIQWNTDKGNGHKLIFCSCSIRHNLMNTVKNAKHKNITDITEILHVQPEHFSYAK